MIQRKKNSGNLFIITAPSGAGKNTIIARLLAGDDELDYSISMTTRPKRAYEIEEQAYYFVNTARFQQLIQKKAFLEWAEVHGNYYGTLKKTIQDILAKGHDAVLDLDVQGAMNLKNMKDIQATFIFIIPPSFESLRLRLEKRGSETEESISLRLENARQEIRYMSLFDYVVVNDVLDKAVGCVQNIIGSQRLRTDNFELTLEGE